MDYGSGYTKKTQHALYPLNRVGKRDSVAAGFPFGKAIRISHGIKFPLGQQSVQSILLRRIDTGFGAHTRFLPTLRRHDLLVIWGSVAYHTTYKVITREHTRLIRPNLLLARYYLIMCPVLTNWVT